MEYRRRQDGLYHAALQIEFGNGGNLTNSRVLVDTEASKCAIPRELNEKFLHLAIAGVDHGVNTALGGTSYEWVVIPKMTLMRKKEIHIGPILYAYDLEETDLSQTNVETWLSDCSVIGMNFMGKFDVRMTKDRRIIFEG